MTRTSAITGLVQIGRGRAIHWPEPATLLWLILTAVLLLLVAFPLAKLLLVSLHTRSGVFTLGNYLAAYGRARYVESLWNSLLLASETAVISVVFAVPMAWAASRTNMPAKSFIWVLVLGSFILPPYLGAIGWILLAGPNAGFLNQAWRWAIGASEPLVNVYTFNGLAFVMAFQSFPLIFIFVKSALDLVSSEMEDAANILGAGTWTAMRKVTLPLVWPSILGGAIIVFLEAVALFGTPAIIGIPARINTATTQLWQFFEYPVRVEVAAAYAMPLLLITLLMVAVQRLMLRRKGFVAQTGKGGERRPIEFGFGRFVLLAYCLIVGLLSVILPVLVLGEASLARAWGNGLAFSNLTLDNYSFLIFRHETALGSIWNTLWFSGTAASLAVVLALLVAYVVSRKLVQFASGLAFLAMAPFVIPGIVMAIGLYAAFAAPPFALYGTATIIILAFTARFLPIAYANASSAMATVHPEMEEAARILGCGRLGTIARITAPLLKRSLLGGWLIVFIVATRELSTAIFLVGPNTRTMAVLLYDLSEAGNFEVLSALGFILLAMTLVLVGIGMKLAGRDFMLRRTQS
ncbi:MAG: iron(III) transport system permease protein [Acetobacteraceae bacterium]|nr:iron(III) transport system permease protein [Acetobacteraceae bacterium]